MNETIVGTCTASIRQRTCQRITILPNMVSPQRVHINNLSDDIIPFEEIQNENVFREGSVTAGAQVTRSNGFGLWSEFQQLIETVNNSSN